MSLLKISEKDLGTLGVLFLIYFVLNAFEIANFNITIDDEFLVHAPPSAFVPIGRWLHALIRETLWPQVVVPFGTHLVFGGCVSLAGLYVFRLFDVEALRARHHLLFGVFVLSPVWLLQLEFAANVIPVGVGVLAACAAALLAKGGGVPTGRPGPAALGLASLLCAASAGAYQSAILIFPILMIGAFLHRGVLPLSPTLPRASLILPPLLVLSIGLLLYLVISSLALAAYGLKASSYGLSHFNPEALRESPWRSLRHLSGDVRGVYLRWWREFGIAGPAFLATLLLGVSCCVAIVRWQPKRMTLAFVLLVVAALLPAAFVFITGGSLPLRTMLGVPFVYLTILLLVERHSTSPTWNRLCTVAVLAMALQSLYVTSVYHARTAVVRSHDLLFAAQVHAEVQRVSPLAGSDHVLLDFHGLKRPVTVYPLIHSASAGASFFEWDGGNPLRMVRYMNLIGYDRYQPILDPAERARVLPYYREMPTWPLQGSVRRIGEVVLVKLSD